MQVRHDEGVAIHIGPEPCAVVREGGGEASVGEHTGQPLSLAKIYIPGADAVANAEGNTDGRVNASARTAPRIELCGSGAFARPGPSLDPMRGDGHVIRSGLGFFTVNSARRMLPTPR